MRPMTKHGFYSIIRKEPGQYHVRSREHQDLENLVDRAPLPQVEIHETPRQDYAFGMIVDQNTVMMILEYLGNTIDMTTLKIVLSILLIKRINHETFAQFHC